MAIQYHVYRSPSPGSPIDYATPVATVSGTTWSSPALADGVHLLAVRAFDGADEELNLDAVVRVEVAPDGSDLSGLPRAPTDLDASPSAPGALRVTWRAAADGPRATSYRVYTGSPTPSYTLPVATVAHVPGASLQAVSLTGLTPGSTLAVAVRAVVAAAEELNAGYVVATVDAGPPDEPDDMVVVAAA